MTKEKGILKKLLKRYTEVYIKKFDITKFNFKEKEIRKTIYLTKINCTECNKSIPSKKYTQHLSNCIVNKE
jgi:hypothetical protein